MQQLEKFPESKMQIRFADCDPFNHLNNSRYIDYFLNAREDHLLAHYQFSIVKIAQEKGLAWLVVKHEIAYMKPAAIMETVVIQSSLRYYDQQVLEVEETMWNEDKTVLKSVLWTRYRHFNLLTRKPESHTPELLSLFASIVVPSEPISLDERAEQIKQRKTFLV